MVSGIWNQLLFLGNRMETMVDRACLPSALASAHLALNLLEHACPEDERRLDSEQAGELRSRIADEATQADALKRLISLTRGSVRTRDIWKDDASAESRLRKLIWTWREAMGEQLFRTLRYQHTRFSPTGGQAGVFLFRVAFDPIEGLIQSIHEESSPPQAWSVQKISDQEAVALISYQRDLRKFYLSGHLPRQIGVAGTDRQEIGGHNPFADWSLAPIMFSVLRAIHGSDPVFPRFKVHQDIDPRLYRSNARYARRVLPSPSESSMGMTMIWSEAMRRAASSGDQAALDRLMPVPEIYLSVAGNGAFVGFVYQMPAERSARGTVYEIGSPLLGTQAILHYEVYRNDTVSPEPVRIPVGVRWIGKPNRLQKHAVKQWIQSEDDEDIRSRWVLTQRSP